MVTAFLVLLQQTDPVAAQLDRMATMLLVIAITSVIVGLLSAITLLVSLVSLRSATRLMKSVESHLDRLAPKTDPLIEKMTRLTDDVRGITDSVRRRVTDLMDTVSDVNDALGKAHRAAEIRVRDFAAVLDVVQSEAEEVLLDGAATAKGFHTTAEALRAGPVRDRPHVPRHAMDAQRPHGGSDTGDDDREAAQPDVRATAPAAHAASVTESEPADE